LHYTSRCSQTLIKDCFSHMPLRNEDNRVAGEGGCPYTMQLFIC